MKFVTYFINFMLKMHLLSVYTENQQLLPKRLLRVVIFPIK